MTSKKTHGSNTIHIQTQTQNININIHTHTKTHTFCCLFDFPYTHMLLFLSLFAVVAGIPSPASTTTRIIDRLLQAPSLFLTWNYGGGITFDAIWQAQATFTLTNYTSILESRLAELQTTDPGAKILRNESMPFDMAVGDRLGLFPIAFLSSPKYGNNTGLEIANRVAQQYVLPWPHVLPDGTFVRSFGWPDPQRLSQHILWGDDQFMGLILLARLAILEHNRDYANFIAHQGLTFATLMQDPMDGLYFHGANAADDGHAPHFSCCKWGRANGWGLMSRVELLLTLEHFNSTRIPMATILKAAFQSHAEAVANYQSPDGRWHQVLNDTSTFLETSATAMIVYSIATAINHGWLDRGDKLLQTNTTWQDVVISGWTSLANNTVKADGTVTGICEGTDIGKDAAFYNDRGTSYLTSEPGLGSVIRAGVAVGEMMRR
eukprot:m.19274 g.19274  ORF g.19274 m.19274 type:complete len:434 (+) comp12201_c0_seq1:88-1389(+)